MATTNYLATTNYPAPIKNINEQDDILDCILLSNIILKLIEKGYIEKFDDEYFDEKEYLKTVCDIFKTNTSLHPITLYHFKFTCCRILKKKCYINSYLKETLITDKDYNNTDDNKIINLTKYVSTADDSPNLILLMSEVANKLKYILEINRDTYENQIQEFEITMLSKPYKFNTLNLYKNIELFQKYVHNKWLETNEFNLVEYLEKSNDFFYITPEKTIIIQLSKIVQELNKIIILYYK